MPRPGSTWSILGTRDRWSPRGDPSLRSCRAGHVLVCLGGLLPGHRTIGRQLARHHLRQAEESMSFYCSSPPLSSAPNRRRRSIASGSTSSGIGLGQGRLDTGVGVGFETAMNACVEVGPYRGVHRRRESSPIEVSLDDLADLAAAERSVLFAPPNPRLSLIRFLSWGRNLTLRAASSCACGHGEAGSSRCRRAHRVGRRRLDRANPSMSTSCTTSRNLSGRSPNADSTSWSNPLSTMISSAVRPAGAGVGDAFHGGVGVTQQFGSFAAYPVDLGVAQDGQ